MGLANLGSFREDLWIMFLHFIWSLDLLEEMRPKCVVRIPIKQRRCYHFCLTNPQAHVSCSIQLVGKPSSGPPPALTIETSGFQQSGLNSSFSQRPNRVAFSFFSQCFQYIPQILDNFLRLCYRVQKSGVETVS